jgi:hypothetical protein
LASVTALVAAVVIVKCDSFAFSVSLRPRSRIWAVLAFYRPPILVSAVLSLPLCYFEPASPLVVIELVLIGSFALSIANLVMSEGVSLCVDSSRVSGLDPWGKFLFFEDFFEMGSGQDLRRKHIFKDSSGRSLKSLISPCMTLFSSFSKKHKQIALSNVSTKIPVSRISDVHLQRARVDQPDEAEKKRDDGSEKIASRLVSQIQFHLRSLRLKLSFLESFFKLLDKAAGLSAVIAIQKALYWVLRIVIKVIVRLFGVGERSKAMETMKTEQLDRLRKEVEALQDSVPVIFAVHGFVGLISSLSKEDGFGLGQRHAEEVLDRLLDVKRALEESVNCSWTLGGFGRRWFAVNPDDLMRRTKRVVDGGVETLLVRFGEKLDLSVMSQANRAMAQNIMTKAW